MSQQTPFDPLRQKLQDSKSPPPTPPNDPRTPAIVILLLVVSICLSLGLAYLVFNINGRLATINDDEKGQIAALQGEIEQLRQHVASQLAEVGKTKEELEEVRSSVGATRSEVRRTKQQTDALRSTQQESMQNLSSQIETKANTAKVDEIEQKAEERFQELDTQITGVKEDVVASREELEKTVEELSGLGLKVSEQGGLIAVTEEGLDELRKRSDRDYFDFKAIKKRRIAAGGIQIELRKTNQKRGHANIRFFFDDRKSDRKVFLNTPVTLLVGPNRTPYEFVMYSVVKDQIQGYIGVPVGTLAPSSELKRTGR
jgi:hypothetical protein